MNEPRIRPSVPGDIAAITRIYGDAVREGTATFEIEPPDEAEMARRHGALLADGFPYLVVEHASAIAGYAHAGHYHVRPAYHWTLENSIYVAPQFQRLGLGAASARCWPSSAIKQTLRPSLCMRRSASAASARCNRSVSSMAAGSMSY
jgi:L-amino acid N-acyltransferase YncA